jgi:hypothetical protein
MSERKLKSEKAGRNNNNTFYNQSRKAMAIYKAMVL